MNKDYVSYLSGIDHDGLPSYIYVRITSPSLKIARLCIEVLADRSFAANAKIEWIREARGSNDRAK